MKWLARLGLAGGLLALAGALKVWAENKTIIIVDKDDVVYDDDRDGILQDSVVNLKPENYDSAMDLRGTPTHVCACGCEIWNLKVSFQDNQISQYFLDMECVNCGSVATAPTPINQENTE